MDHLAVFDGFGSTSLDLSPLPASELVNSSPCRPDKGKARARDTADDDVHIVGFHLAGPSRTNRDGNAFGAHDLDHRTSTSPAYSNSKGKAKQQVPDPDLSYSNHPVDPHNDSLEHESRSSQSRQSRRPRVNASVQLGGDDFQASTSQAPFNPEDTSLKRSIRELGSSPSHSPHQHTASLPSLEADRSMSACRSNTAAHPSASSSSSSLQSATGTVYARPSTSNKKRRSERNPTEEQDSSHASGWLSTSNQESSTPQTVAAQPSRTAVPLRPSSRESLSSLRSNARRASLLVNSSTSATRSLDNDNGSFCVSPEPMDVHTRFNESRHDLSQRRSAFLDDTRAQRSSGTIRRRRGFYLRDADLLRNEPSNDTLPTSDRPNSAASDTSFMADFARAVDLRLGTRTDNAHSYATSPTSELLNTSTQRRPPQLPYVRAASPLTVPIPFAPTDHDNSGHYAAYVRRRADAQSLDRVQQSERNERHGFSPAISHRIAYNPNFWESPPTHSSSRPEGMARTSQNDSYRNESLQREPNQANESSSNRADLATATASSTMSERPDTWRSYQGQSPASTAQTRSSDATATQDFGAVRRPFGQQGSRATRQSLLRSRAQAGGTETRATAADIEPRRSRDWSLHAQADPVPRRQADDMPGQRDSLPWRRTHFGVRTSSHYLERHPSVAAQPRFDPFAEGNSPDSRRFTANPLGSVGSRGSLSTSLRQERSENESALAYLGRLMSHDSMLDEWMAGDVHGPLLRMAIESEVLISNPHLRHLGYPPASTSSMFGRTPHLAFDARNFIADEDWAELNSYEGLMQLSERLGAAEICVPQSLIDTLPTCEYGKWDGGSCRPRGESATPPPSKGKGKQKVEPPATTRDTICPICREDYLDSDMLMSINKCCHAFHADCIKTWFKSAKSCPLCRADAFDEISLPALSFQTSSSASSSTRTAAAAAAAAAERPTWSLNF